MTVECVATPLIVERLVISQAWRAATLDSGRGSAQSFSCWTIFPPARRLYQSRAALRLRRRSADTFSGRPNRVTDRPKSAHRINHRNRHLLFLRDKNTKRARCDAGMPERRNACRADRLSADGRLV